MAKQEQYPKVSEFTRRFAAALEIVMSEHGVSQSAVARSIDRTQGYVSERVRGVRSPDTDVIAGVAMVAGVQPATIVTEVMTQMRGARVPLDAGADPSL